MGESFVARGAAALRDFFASVDAGDLESAASDIARRFSLPLDPDTDWTAVEYDFNRLFVGPAAVPAPPYASAYQEGQEEPALMRAPALEVRQAYALLGLVVPDQGAAPDDHLAFELDAAVALESLAGTEDEMAALKKWLVAEHMAGWIPRFASAVKGQEGVTAPVAMAVEALAAWLEAARSGAGTAAA